MEKIGNKYYVYDKNGKILIITTNRRIADNVYNTRVVG